MKQNFNEDDFKSDFAKVIPSAISNTAKSSASVEASDIQEGAGCEEFRPARTYKKKVKETKQGITLSLKVDLSYDEYKSLQLLVIEQSKKIGKKVTVTALAISQLKKLANKKGMNDE